MKKMVVYTEDAEAFARSMPDRTRIRLRRIIAHLEEDGRLVWPFGEKAKDSPIFLPFG